MGRIENFLENYEKKNSIKCHRLNLKYYFNFIGVEPDEYFNDNRDYNQNFIDYAQSIKHLAPYTRSSRLSTVKLFFDENDVTLTTKTLKKTTSKIRNRVQTIDNIPKPEEFKQILNHGAAKDRALFLFAATSGCRINEILSLELADIPSLNKYENRQEIEFPIKIYIRAEIAKNDAPRVAFISKECWEALLEWMKERDAYLDAAVRRTNKRYKKDPNDNRLFPFCYTTAFEGWHRLLRKAGYHEKDRTTGRVRMHIHVLRAYFKNRLITANVQERLIEKLMGHIGYVGGAYDKFSIQELAEAYKRGEKELLVFESQPDLSGVHEELSGLRDENKEMSKEMELMKQKIHLLEMQVEQEKIKKELRTR